MDIRNRTILKALTHINDYIQLAKKAKSKEEADIYLSFAETMCLNTLSGELKSKRKGE